MVWIPRALGPLLEKDHGSGKVGAALYPYQEKIAGIDGSGNPEQIHKGAPRGRVLTLDTFRTTFVSTMKAQTRSRIRYLARSLTLALLPVLLGVRGTGGQEKATLRVEENLRAEPQGVVLGRLSAGSSFSVMEISGQWVRLEVQGWIWTRSVGTTDRMGFDLAVSVAPGENLRLDPSGAILGQLSEGALLERLESVPGWTRVRRVAWIWGPSVTVSASEQPGAMAPAPARGVPVGVSAEPAGRWWRSGPDGASLLSGPDGDTLARLRSGTEVSVLAREGNWIRIRLEGWSWAPMAEEPDSSLSASLSDVTLPEVLREPGSHRGRVVAWELQFVSLERAERLRTDFFEGEPFLLMRAAPPGSAFVYVAVPPERLGEVEGLIPLERMRIVGRIRTGAAALTGNPILELLELTRLR
jgi:hypothetical protein